MIEVEERWKRIRQEMENKRARNKFGILTGDLNKLVGNNELGLPGNQAEVSLGGRLLKEMLSSRKSFIRFMIMLSIRLLEK